MELEHTSSLKRKKARKPRSAKNLEDVDGMSMEGGEGATYPSSGKRRKKSTTLAASSSSEDIQRRTRRTNASAKKKKRHSVSGGGVSPDALLNGSGGLQPIGRALTVKTRQNLEIDTKELLQSRINTVNEEPDEYQAEFHGFVTTLYGYLINRTLDECNKEDIASIFSNFLTMDLVLGKHCVRAECINQNWNNYVFRNPPGFDPTKDKPMESPFAMTTLLYVSKTKGAECEFPNCACKTTQGHLRWTKSVTGHLLELFTFDWQHHEVQKTYAPIGFD